MWHATWHEVVRQIVCQIVPCHVGPQWPHVPGRPWKSLEPKEARRDVEPRRARVARRDLAQDVARTLAR
eukprot:7327626-Alexandrium_andersonii.AAC.1